MELRCQHYLQINAQMGLNLKALTKKKKFSFRSGQWKEDQQVKYYAFLRKYCSKFFILQDRIHYRVFKALSLFVKSRNSDQCRSHHHKIHKKGSSIEDTLSFLEVKYPSLKEKSKKYEEQLEKQEKYLFGILQLQKQEEKDNPVMRQVQICKAQEKQEGPYEKTSVAYQNFEPQKKRLCLTLDQRLVEQILQQKISACSQLVPQKDVQGKQGLFWEKKVFECNLLFLAWFQKLSSLLQPQGR